ncbi:hypothetical protein [Streptomyces halobius]|uniref:Peptidase inhibitor family I36 n=1 Tax=Streptomyces halobius TaxID=2879846 RepID=A0ABY4MDC7_9ACTN|nr:hypothetical protein [Streptomyces halobius]UQA95685.1 hypothetical protein K9S39_30890 [Streptomyces halobius]
MKVRHKIGALLASAVAVGGVVMTAAPAQAGTWKVSDNCDVPWISCSYGDLWLFYNSKQYAVKDGRYVSAYATFYGNVYDHRGTARYQGSTLDTYRYVFDSGSNGDGQYMKNNSASVQNCARDDGYAVYYNSGYGGTAQYFKPNGGWGDCNHTNLISALKNNNASSHFA